MQHIVSFSDNNYLIKGLAMYESLLRHSKDFILHYLCLDYTTYHVMSQLPHIKVYEPTDLDPSDFNTTKENFTSHVNDLSWFHFALTPVFTYHIAKTLKVPVMYVDADIFLYNDINLIYKSVENFSIGLMTHKHIGKEEKTPVGYFNVGIMFFDNDIVGFEALKWWKEQTIDKTNPYYSTHGTCGDQKYLELLPDLFGKDKIKVIDEDIGHAAPWNHGFCKDITPQSVTWDCKNVISGKELVTQPMLAYHFSHFTPYYERNGYRVDRGGEWGNVVGRQQMKDLYDNYFLTTKEIKERYKL